MTGDMVEDWDKTPDAVSGRWREDGQHPRVVHAPTRHPYVDHIQPIGGTTLVSPLRAAEIINPQWMQAHLPEFDVLHLHFQLRELASADLRASIRLVKKSGRRLAFTVHDLVDPQAADQRHHNTQLDILIEQADLLFTLTPGAAKEVRDGWGRDALVLPHPHVLPLDRIGRDRPAINLPVVAVHLKSGRPGLLASPVLRALFAVHDPSAWTLRVDLNIDGMESLVSRDPDLSSLITLAADMPSVELHQHSRFSDREFFDYLEAIDVAVLPYRFGTHSGWAEACLDAAVTVVSPLHMHIHEQHQSIIGFDFNSMETLEPALRLALDATERQVWSSPARRRQRESIVKILGASYRQEPTGQFRAQMLS